MFENDLKLCVKNPLIQSFESNVPDIEGVFANSFARIYLNFMKSRRTAQFLKNPDNVIDLAFYPVDRFNRSLLVESGSSALQTVTPFFSEQLQLPCSAFK